jgi:hypothetical protein
MARSQQELPQSFQDAPQLFEAGSNVGLTWNGQMSRKVDMGAVRLAMTGGALALPADFGDFKIAVADKEASDAAPTVSPSGKGKSQVQPPRLDAFDSKKEPADHMRCDTEKAVCGSGRVVPGEKNLLGLVGFIHQNDAALQNPNMTQIDREQALRGLSQKTAILDFRVYDDPTLDKKALASNNREMSAEQSGSAALGIKYFNFPMDSKVPQTPEHLQTIDDTMDQEVQAGNTVSVHCYHGTDRTGLALAVYESTHDARLVDLLQNHGQKGVDDVYSELKRSLLDSGVEPSTHAAIFQSLQQFLQFRHDGQNGSVVTDVSQMQIDDGQRGQLKMAHNVLAKSATMASYMSVLKDNIDRYDPSSHGAFYRQLYHDFNRSYIEQNTPKTSD